MPKDKQMNKVLVIGSGPIVIGQAAEFDYAGTQACLTLREEGCEVILINNNPATIMTDEEIAHKVYFEPLTTRNIETIMKKERPDGLLATVSGQTGLNLAYELQTQGSLDKYQVQLLGTPMDAIMKGEDRHKFRHLMQELHEPIPESTIIDSLADGLAFCEKIGFPVIVRPAYTLGGAGGGIAVDEKSFTKYVTSGLRTSPIHQCLIEKSIAGWKEIEFEVIRDRVNQAVIVCHMENIDPVGVHTGDSMVVSPIQTLSKKDITMLREASLHIVESLGIIGACNVQLAIEPTTKEYIIIEVNPRVSRSSALASKVTGYPIAKIATKLSLGYTLDEMNYQGESLATYEPLLDYVAVKIPCWPFDKLSTVDRKLGTQMKATGEVLAIEKNMTAALQKAIRSLDLAVDGLSYIPLQNKSDKVLHQFLLDIDDRRLFVILELIRRGYPIQTIHQKTKIDCFFLEEMNKLIQLESNIQKKNLQSITMDELLQIKQAGFTNSWLAKKWNCSIDALKEKLANYYIFPTYEAIRALTQSKVTDSVYYYSVWKQEKPNPPVYSDKEKIMIIGSGPIRIGQGIEFDYCSVQGIKALQSYGYETVLINNNPATVSTDYQLADRLYIEPITIDDILQVIEYEGIQKVIVQFGGQTALNLVNELEHAGVQLLGSTMDTIDMLEDRERFYQYIRKINLAHIPGLIANSESDLKEKAKTIGFPLLIRPSYVIGGEGMEIIRAEQQLHDYITDHIKKSSYPILIDAYYPGKEIDVDVVTDGNSIFIPAIFEHIEKAGVHSGDSMVVTPPISLSEFMKKKIVDYTERVAFGMNFTGIFNIQFVIHEDELYVLEVNPRASRTVPISSKATGENLIKLATGVLLGKSILDKGKIRRENDFYTVKAPVFSNAKLPGISPTLVPTMKSTGEVMAVSPTYSGSLTKAFLWNQSLQQKFLKKIKEMYIADEGEYLPKWTKQLKAIGITTKQFPEDTKWEEIKDWMKSKEAFAVYSSDEESVALKLAQDYGLITLSSKDTIAAFLQTTREVLPIQTVEQLLYEKEVNV